MNLYRLIYKSRATVPVDAETVLSIATASQRRNREFGITGMLLATNAHFLQVLEGEQEAVSKAYEHIVKDSRHSGLILVSCGAVNERRFRKWAMKGVGLMGYGAELKDLLRRKYGVEDGDVRFPVEESRALALFYDVVSFEG
ncbi:MAG: hypothetical protein GTO30_22415 [Acidobacteria bacterium]|nr:hypothetical protein [Acidobacteriota bacterium]NIM64305.1 hypothetical protein [Acidobacteriota bacterium]NIO60937.1 hypothetical protein [Acidobacteriota bacterium]NIQ87406.1 hypothetical protein [Acidobacteriota bacterium]NIT12591.1 hypothetical protein [Acidobacteriota bacterium]